MVQGFHHCSVCAYMACHWGVCVSVFTLSALYLPCHCVSVCMLLRVGILSVLRCGDGRWEVAFVATCFNQCYFQGLDQLEEWSAGREGGRLCQLPIHCHPTPGFIVPSTQTHPVGTIRRSDRNLPFRFPGLSNGGWGLGEGLDIGAERALVRLSC